MKKEKFIKLHTWIFKELKLSGNDAVLYALLYSLADDSGICKPSNAYLADYFHVKERTVQRWLESLQKKNHIQRTIFELGVSESSGEFESYRIITVMKKMIGCQDCRTNKNNNIDIYNTNSSSIDSILLVRQDCHPKDVLDQIGRFFNEKETEYLLSKSEEELMGISNDYSNGNRSTIKRYFLMKNKHFNAV